MTIYIYHCHNCATFFLDLNLFYDASRCPRCEKKQAYLTAEFEANEVKR